MNEKQEKIKVCWGARKAATIILSYCCQRYGEGRYLFDARSNSVNPYHHRTKNGLFLELPKGYPRILWTPWGEWEFAKPGSGSWEGVLPDILKRFAARPEDPLSFIDDKAEGQVYGIYAIDGETLPEPVLRSRDIVVDFEGVRSDWHKFCHKKRKKRNN